MLHICILVIVVNFVGLFLPLLVNKDFHMNIGWQWTMTRQQTGKLAVRVMLNAAMSPITNDALLTRAGWTEFDVVRCSATWRYRTYIKMPTYMHKMYNNKLNSSEKHWSLRGTRSLGCYYYYYATYKATSQLKIKSTKSQLPVVTQRQLNATVYT